MVTQFVVNFLCGGDGLFFVSFVFIVIFSKLGRNRYSESYAGIIPLPP